MRKIQFRAWDTKHKHMFKVKEFGFSENNIWCTSKRNGYEHWNPIIMQYTGFKDKNGREIYEGDILSTDLSRPYLIVCFRNGAFMVQCHDDGKDYYDLMVSIDEENDQIEHLEVIGNIYENPEFLELMPE